MGGGPHSPDASEAKLGAIAPWHRCRISPALPPGYSRAMRYQLYYWSTIQGRGEFVRLALEEAGADYIDVARKRGDKATVKLIARKSEKHPPFAPPILKAGKRVIAQTANILFYLGPRLGLAPKDEAG